MPHPYKSLPARNFWKSAVSASPWNQVFDGERGKFRIGPAQVVATGGSCFAQRIARHLRARGYGYTCFEPPHPLMDVALAAKLGYDTYSARYGNLYTTRQLKQLVDEAFERRAPIIDIAQAASGKFVDLLRPGIHDGGFASVEEATADRAYHLGRVRQMFLEAEVFIFTLGLTETWADPERDVVYGVHPAVATGVDVGLSTVPVNLDYIDCFNDLVGVVNFLREQNPRLRFVFTVSPVALAATHQASHVLAATTYSKSVLRAVAGKLTDQCPFADYFPSYEFFTAAQSFGQYLGEDLRDVSSRGVQTVMRLFEAMFMKGETPPSVNGLATAAVPAPTPAPVAKTLPVDAAAAECEEVLNAAFG